MFSTVSPLLPGAKVENRLTRLHPRLVKSFTLQPSILFYNMRKRTLITWRIAPVLHPPPAPRTCSVSSTIGISAREQLLVHRTCVFFIWLLLTMVFGSDGALQVAMCVHFITCKAANPVLDQCWASVADAGSTLNQHWVNQSIETAPHRDHCPVNDVFSIAKHRISECDRESAKL